MDKLLLHKTSTALWHALVGEAENHANLNLNEELESYLIFLLMRFTNNSQMAANVLALEFLNGLQQFGSSQKQVLQDVGDKCLLFSGLFPARAEKLRVNISYFVDLGQSAYGTLAQVNTKPSISELYQSLHKCFVPLMDVLQSMRELAEQGSSLTPLQAQQLWQDCQSQNAKTQLQRILKHSDNLY